MAIRVKDQQNKIKILPEVHEVGSRIEVRLNTEINNLAQTVMEKIAQLQRTAILPDEKTIIFEDESADDAIHKIKVNSAQTTEINSIFVKNTVQGE